MPGPTNGDSSATPSRLGIPACAFSANSRYRASVPSSTASARHGVAKLPPTTTLGVPASAPSSIASCRSVMMRIEAAGKSVAADAPSVHDRRRDADEVPALPRDPRRQRGPLQAAGLLAVGDRPRLPDNGHAPANVSAEVHAVGLERDDGPAGRGGELALGVRPDNDVAIDEREVDKLDCGQRLPGIDDPADGDQAHQSHALIP